MDSQLREFLVGLYLLHGEREFVMTHVERIKTPELHKIIIKCRVDNKYITIRDTTDAFYMYTLTPEAIKLIKEGTE